MAGKTIGELTTLENPSSSAVIPISADGSTLQKTTFGDVANKYITNCLTEIPQDIKLEINNGTLTLKTGSKVYVPNGVGVFDVLTIASDINMDGGTATGTELVYITADGTWLYHYLDNSSGTDWNATSQYQCRYNTSANMIKNTNDTGSTWIGQVSFPIAKVTLSSGTVTNIDQVFNGFGYIGESVFVLPGVKFLVPNGRKNNGTLNNTFLTIDAVKVRNLSTEASKLCFLHNNGVYGYGVYNYFEQPTAPSNFGTYATWYNTVENVMYETTTSGASWTKQLKIYLGKMEKTGAGSNITLLEPKTPFCALDYNTPHIIETYKNGNNWFRLYSDGWCEQGGYIGNTINPDTVTLFKPYKGYYSIQLSVSDTSPTDNALTVASWNNQSITNFTVYRGYNGTAQPSMPLYWETKGYIL